MKTFQELLEQLSTSPRKWAITGVAGFIGSHILETLLANNQFVVGLDNFSTGYERHLEEIKATLPASQWNNFTLIKGDVRNLADCHEAVNGADFVLHQAAIGSVPWSLDNPTLVNENNINGHLNMLVASRDARVKSFTYAASSSTYGDDCSQPKTEQRIGKPLSPYAVTKYVNELYANVFDTCYNFKTIGLRYFNVFGPRQDPEGAYAAVIPKWIATLAKNESPTINGDGKTTRDFCYVENVVQANILAALATESAKGEIYNIAFGESISLNILFEIMRKVMGERTPETLKIPVKYDTFREGDIRYSEADISKARNYLNYNPYVSTKEGLKKTLMWFSNNDLTEI